MTLYFLSVCTRECWTVRPDHSEWRWTRYGLISWYHYYKLRGYFEVGWIKRSLLWPAFSIACLPLSFVIMCVRVCYNIGNIIGLTLSTPVVVTGMDCDKADEVYYLIEY